MIKEKRTMTETLEIMCDNADKETLVEKVNKSELEGFKVVNAQEQPNRVVIVLQRQTDVIDVEPITTEITKEESR